MKPSSSIPRVFLAIFVVVILLSSCAVPAQVSIPTLTATAVNTSTITPTATLLPDIYLSDLTPLDATVGFGGLGVGIYNTPGDPSNGKLIHAHDQDYPDGLMAHAPSRLSYGIDGKYRLFRTQVLVQDEMQCDDGVIFKVLLDGQEAYASPVLSGADEPLTVELDVSGVQVLALVVDQREAGDCDWAIWGDPLLVPVGSVAASYPTATARPTATLDPNLPCGGMMPEKVYLFLDCSDIRRIRADVQSGDLEFSQYWDALVATVDTYRANFPGKYDPDASGTVLWWGTGNYIARDMALVYLVTGDPAYARDLVRLLNLVITNTPPATSLVNFSEDDGHGYLYAGGLMSHPRYNGVVYQSVLFGYFAVRDTDLFDAKKREEYDLFFINQSNLLEQVVIRDEGIIGQPDWENNNIFWTENFLIATIGAAFQDDPQAKALYDRARQRLEQEVPLFWGSDGGWGRGVEGYGFFALEELILWAESEVKNGGENTYAHDFSGFSIEKACMHYLMIATPEGYAPSINDTHYGFADPGVFILCSKRTNNPLLMLAAQEYIWGYKHAFGYGSLTVMTPFETIVWWDPEASQSLPTPGWTSVLLPSTGLGIFRSDWSHEAQYGLLKYTSSAVHAHYSFGEFLLYDHGPWIIGNGYHLGSQYNMSINTTSASTLTLDNLRQEKVGGALAAFTPLNQTGYMAVTSPAYSNMIYTRSVLWNQAWHQWIIVDDAALKIAPVGHTFQVRWYVRGTADSHDESGNWIFTRPDYSGYLSVQMPSLQPASYSAITRDFGPEFGSGDEGNAGGVGMEIAASAAETRLVSVLTYSPDKPGAYPALSRDDSGQGTLLTTQPAADSPAWDWLLAAPGATDAEAGEYTMTGSAGCAWKRSGILQGYCLYAGTSLKQDRLALIASDQRISAEVDYVQGIVALDAPVDSTLTVYWPATVSAVISYGASLPFKLEYGMLSVSVPAGQYSLIIKP